MISTSERPSSSSVVLSKQMPASEPAPWSHSTTTVRSAGYSVRPYSRNSRRLSSLPMDFQPQSVTLSKSPSLSVIRLRVPPVNSSNSHSSAPPASMTMFTSSPTSAIPISYMSRQASSWMLAPHM